MLLIFLHLKFCVYTHYRARLDTCGLHIIDENLVKGTTCLYGLLLQYLIAEQQTATNAAYIIHFLLLRRLVDMFIHQLALLFKHNSSGLFKGAP